MGKKCLGLKKGTFLQSHLANYEPKPLKGQQNNRNCKKDHQEEKE